MTGGAVRLTVSIRHRSGAGVLLQDSGPMFDIADALRLVTEVRTAIAEHGDGILRGETELIVRCAARAFKADDGDPVRKPPAMPAVKRSGTSF